MTDVVWRKWFAWRPVTLLSGETYWLRWVSRRPFIGRVPGDPSWAGDGRWSYSWVEIAE